jgi:hypothetical protein
MDDVNTKTIPRVDTLMWGMQFTLLDAVLIVFIAVVN